MALATAKDAKETGNGKEPAVLVIDPNEEHQVLSTMALGRRGFRVTIAGTGREGLRLALSQPFAVIVIDLKLRDTPALDLLSVLRERIPDVPKILVVVAGQEQTAVKALASGASGFLVKTARYNELLPSEVEAQIRAAQARRSLKEQKKALGESEERFQKAFRASPVALTIVSRNDGKFIEANDAFLRLVGYSRGELIGRTEAELSLQVDPAVTARNAAALAHGGTIREVEAPFRTKAGETRAGLASVESIEIEGEPCILTILRDATEERRVEKLQAALFEISEAATVTRDLSELFKQIHRTVAGLMPAENLYIALYDPATEMLSFPYFVDEKEPTPTPYKAGRGLTEFVLRSASPLLVTPTVFGGMLERGDVETVGVTGVDWLGVPLTADGKTFGVLAVQSYAETIRYTEEEKQLLSLVSAQVALAVERKRSDEALRSAEARFRTMFTDAPLGIALADLDGRFRETNPAFQRMLGCGPEELRGLHFTEVTHPDDVAMSLARSEETLSGRRERALYEKRFVRKDGTSVWARVTIALLRTSDGAPKAVMGMIDDITQEKEAFEAREKERRRFETLVAKMSDGVSLAGPDGTISWQSPSAARMFGFSPDEALGKSGLEFVHPDDLAQAAEGFADLMASPGKTLTVEVRLRHKDGSWRWTEVIGSNHLNDPELRSIVFNYRDITDRNEALEQIRFQAHLLGQVRNAVVATDTNLRIVFWNEHATTMFGWRSSEALGKSLRDLIIPAEDAAAFDATSRLVQAEGHWEGERNVVRKNGSRFPTSVTVTALHDRDGKTVGFVSVTSDITDRLNAEKELESRARQQAAIAALGQKALVEPALSALLNEAVATLTATLHVEYGSVLELTPDRSAFSLRAKVAWDLPLGTRIENNPGESLAAYTLVAGQPVILESPATETRFRLSRLSTDRGLKSGISVPIQAQTGLYGVLCAQSRSQRAFSADDIDFVTAVANVIASAIERTRIEKALAQNERLASLGQLAAYVAHEINTPLTNISLLSSSIARRVSDPEILRKLEAIGEQRRKATAIVTDLVEMPRQTSLRRVPEDLRKVIAAAAEEVEPYRKPEVSLVVDARDRAAFANIDTIQIRDVFVCLLRNALQVTMHGSVTVRLVELPEYLFVSVEDTGAGLAPDALEELFHPVRGSGQEADESFRGFALSRTIVAAHGGKIQATSEVGKGSTFTVILPRFETR